MPETPKHDGPRTKRCPMCGWQMFLEGHAEDAVPTYYCSNKACEPEERAACVLVRVPLPLTIESAIVCRCQLARIPAFTAGLAPPKR
jgi:hypothetical protein